MCLGFVVVDIIKKFCVEDFSYDEFYVVIVVIGCDFY